MKEVQIFTDGACSGNPGPGGWGAILRYGDKVKELSGGDADTTNNRMELMAAIAGLEALTRPCQVDLYSDSKDAVWKNHSGGLFRKRCEGKISAGAGTDH